MIFVLSFHDVKFYFLIGADRRSRHSAFAGKSALKCVSKIEPIRENAVTKAYYGSCLHRVMGSR